MAPFTGIQPTRGEWELTPIEQARIGTPVFTLPPTVAPVVPPAVITPAAPAAPVVPPPRPFNFNTDPGYIAALAAERTGRESLDALLRRRRAEAMIAFGDPDWALANGLDPNSIEATRALSKAGLSTLARLEKNRGLRRSSVINKLAGSGMLFSGELGYQERENEALFGQERYDQQQSVLRALAGEQDSVTQQQQALRNAVVQALQSSYQNYLANPYLYSGQGF